MADCVFCKIVSGDVPAKKKYEDGEIVAFADINPVSPVHVVVIPKRHIANLSVAQAEDTELLGKMQLVSKKVAHSEGISDAFRVLTASGKRAGQSVFHLHYHVIGGWQGDPPGME